MYVGWVYRDPYPFRPYDELNQPLVCTYGSSTNIHYSLRGEILSNKCIDPTAAEAITYSFRSRLQGTRLPAPMPRGMQPGAAAATQLCREMGPGRYVGGGYSINS